MYPTSKHVRVALISAIKLWNKIPEARVRTRYHPDIQLMQIPALARRIKFIIW